MALRFGVELVVLHVIPPMFVPVGLAEGTAFVGAELQEAYDAAAAQVTERLKGLFRKVCEPRVVPAHWRRTDGDPGMVVPFAARTADLVVAAAEASTGIDALAPSVAEQLPLNAGVPALLLPAAFAGEPDVRRAVVGWNGSREAARAAHDALPFLVVAEEVTVVALGEPGTASVEQAAAMLGRHGVHAKPYTEKSTHDAGERLLALAEAREADLLVMGAYGRARLRELILGGATRDVLASTTLPLLLSA